MQINQAEQTALLQPISNDARTLYLLALKQIVDENSGVTTPLNYKSLLTLLNAKDEKYTLGRQVNSLLKELLNVGLISFRDKVELNHSFNGKVLLLPLTTMKADEYSKLHLNWHKMTLDWVPNEKLASDLSKLVGIIEYEYTSTELGDFIAYWLGRPESQFTEYQWTQKFVFNLKKIRLAHGFKPVQKVGQQLVKARAGIEADENAKNLVAKYGKSNNT